MARGGRRIRMTFAAQILLAIVFTGVLAYEGWIYRPEFKARGSAHIKIRNRFKTSEQVTFSCPPGKIYFINVTRGKTYDLKVPEGTQNLWCLFARKLNVNYWDCKGVIELQLTCTTGLVECKSYEPIRSLTFNQHGVIVNGETKVHSKWLSKYKGEDVARNQDMVLEF